MTGAPESRAKIREAVAAKGYVIDAVRRSRRERMWIVLAHPPGEEESAIITGRSWQDVVAAIERYWEPA